MKSIYFIFIIFVCFSGCVKENLPIHVGDENGTYRDTVYVSFNTHISTRSSASPDENALKKLTVMAYRDGLLERAGSSYEGKDILLPLLISEEYDLYAVANIDFQPPFRQDELEKSRFIIDSVKDLNGPMAMAWSRKDVTLSPGMTQMQVNLERLASRISFSVDASLLPGIEVRSVRMRQCAMEMDIFPSSGSSRVTEASQTGDGDSASSQDIADVNSGKPVFFYTLENCQGTLLPENQDPWGKIPDALGEKTDLCTYIEAECSFAPGHVLEGDVTYRFYPGSDNISNFDVRRNRDLRVTLCPSSEGLKGISWKIEADVTVTDGAASGWLDEGMHPLDDMYIGEEFYYGVDVAEELLTYLGGDLSRCSLSFEGSGKIDFCIPTHTAGTSTMYVSGTCTDDGTGEIWLYGPEGTKVCKVSETVTIRKPHLVVSLQERSNPFRPVESIEEEPKCLVNGAPTNIYLYLTDSKGYNLNTGYWSGFDLSQFSFEKSPHFESDFRILENFSVDVTDGTSESDGPASIYGLNMINKGDNPQTNSDISRAISQFGALKIDLDERRHQMSSGCSVGIDFFPVTLTLVDNGWAEYYPCQVSLKIGNRSNVPLMIDVWQVNTHDNDWSAIGYDQLVKLVDENYIVKRPQYITNSYYDNDNTLYGSRCSIRSERNIDGDPYIEDGKYIVYPLDDISTTVISNTIRYDKRGQRSLVHLIDATIGYERLSADKISVKDSLSDGSMKYDIIYGNDPEYGGGWDDQGIWLYSMGGMLYKPNTFIDTYNNLSVSTLSNLMGRYAGNGPMNIILTYDSSSGQLYARCPKGNMFGIKLDASITVSAEGYVQTHPNGTWFAAKDNYCSASSSRALSSITISSGNTSIDGGAIRECMNKIYNTTFFDSKNAIGSSNSYQHSAHPTRVTATLKVKVSGTDKDFYPVSFTWTNSSLDYYHPQDGTTYYPSFVKNLNTFSFVQTRER